MISVGSEVQVLPDPPNCLKPFERPKLKNTGGIAQLVEHLLCKQGVIGSIPFASTKDQVLYSGRNKAFANKSGLR